MPFIICETSLNYLKWARIWPQSSQEEIKTYRMKYILMYLSTTPLLILNILHLIKFSLKEENVDLTPNVVIIASRGGIFYFMTQFVFHQHKVGNVISKLSNFHDFGKPIDFEKHKANLDRVANFFNNIIFIAAVCVVITPIMNVKECEKLNETRIFKDVCGLVAGVWLPFDFSHFPVKQIICAYQFYCEMFILRGGAMLSLFVMEIMEHFIIRLKHLRILIKKIVSLPDPNFRRKEFGNWLRYHNHILSLGKEMNEGLKSALFVHVLITGVLFGCIGYSLMTNISIGTLSFAFLFFGWLSSLMVVCISGQRLIDSSLSVGLAAYNTQWYETDTKFQKDIMMVIKRSRIPIVVNAGPFSNLSHLIILKILQTAYSYLNLLGATSKN